MARDPLISGLYVWPKDRHDDYEIYTYYGPGMVYWCLGDGFNVFLNGTTIEPDEVLIAPKVIADWRD